MTRHPNDFGQFRYNIVFLLTLINTQSINLATISIK